MSWLIFAALGVAAGTIANLYQKIALRSQGSDPAAFAIAFQIITGTMYAVVALTSGFQLPNVSLLGAFLVSSALYACGTVFFFRAIQRIEASEMSILSGVGSIITIIISLVFLGDRLSFIQLVGALCIFASVVIIHIQKNGFTLNQGAWWALAGTSSYGIAVTFDAYIIRQFETASFMPLSAAGTTLILGLWYYRKIPTTFRLFKNFDRNLWIYSVLYGTSAIMFYQGIHHGALVGQMSTIFRATIILTVILSTILLKEHKNLGRKIVAALLTTLGVLLVSS